MFWTILMMSFRTVDSFLNPNISVLFSLEFSGLHYCLFVKVHSYFSVTFLFSATWLGYHVSHALSSIVLHKIESFFSFYFLIKWNLSEFSFLRNILIKNPFRKFFNKDNCQILSLSYIYRFQAHCLPQRRVLSYHSKIDMSTVNCIFFYVFISAQKIPIFGALLVLQ